MSNSPQNVDDAVAPSSPRTVTYDTESESRMSPQPPPDEEAQPFEESQGSSAEEDLDTVLRRHDTDALIDSRLAPTTSVIRGGPDRYVRSV